MTVERFAVGHRTVLRVAGVVDVGSSPALRSAAEGAIERGAHELWVDLGATEFIDSAGLRVLLDLHGQLRALGRSFALICPAGPVRRLFDVDGVADAIPLYPDRAAAHHAA